MKMKKWMALSCAAAMVLSTFPVSADEAVNEDVSGSITVWEHAYSFEEALKAVIEGFKAKYPNVEVDYEIKASDYLWKNSKNSMEVQNFICFRYCPMVFPVLFLKTLRR